MSMSIVLLFIVGATEWNFALIYDLFIVFDCSESVVFTVHAMYIFGDYVHTTTVVDVLVWSVNMFKHVRL